MKKEENEFNNSRTGKIVFMLSLLVSGFWFLGNFIAIYRFAVVGAIFEILWLPFLALLFTLPVLSLVLWSKEKYTIKSLYFYSVLLLAATVLFMVFST